MEHRSVRIVVLNAVGALSVLVSSAAGAQAVPEKVSALNARVETMAAQSAPRDNGELRSLLSARHDAVAQTIRLHPETARGLALSPATRDALLAADPSLDPLLETGRVLVGELAPQVGDDFEHGTASMLYTLHTFTREIDLSFAAVPAHAAALAHRQVTVNGYGFPELVAVDSLRPATPAECAAAAPPVAAAVSPADQSQAAAAPASCSALGSEPVAVLLLKFAPAGSATFPTGLDQPSFWKNVYFGSNPSVAGFYNEGSQSQTQITGDVFGPFTLSSSYDCTTTSAMQTAAIAAAAGTVDFSQYNRIALVYPVNSCTFGGLGNLGCVSATSTITHPYSVTWIPVSGPGAMYPYSTTYPKIWTSASHELGHNLGLNHSNTLNFGSALTLGPIDFAVSTTGTVNGGNGSSGASNIMAVNTEYGDYFPVMGYPWSPAGPYPVQQRNRVLGWIPNSDVPDITTSGTYNLVPAENTSGRRGLHILRDAHSSAWLSVEFNQNTNVYTGYMLAAVASNTLTTGAHIFYDNPYGDPLYTYLLDFTPSASANFFDGNLAPGKSWSDPYSLLTLSVGTQTATSLPVTVSYDSPCATVALTSPSIAAAGGSSSVTITAPSTCGWTVSSNATWITFPGATSGSGNATVPFTASANTAAPQRNTYITAQRQSLPLVQAGTGPTLSSFTPSGGSSVAGVAQAFKLSYSDGTGLSDISQINITFAGTPSCMVSVVYNSATAYAYLYDSTTGKFTSSSAALTATGGSGSAATSGCSISGAGGSYVPNGNSAVLTLNLTFSSAMVGTHTITASAYATSASTGSVPFGNWVVTSSSLSSTTVALTSTATSVTFGQSVTLNAAVSPAAATGTVTFMEGAATLGAGTLSAGAATFTTASLAAGQHNITAVYGGDSAYATSSSSALTLTIAQGSTSTALTASATSLLPSGSTLLTATVSPAAATGSVTFKDGMATLGTVTLTNGVGAWTASGLGAGSHSITAVYAGDSSFNGSTSAAVSVAVAKGASTTTLASVAAPVYAGNTVTLTVTVASSSGTPAGTPGGTVTFTDGSTTLATATLAGGTATFTTAALSAGSHSFTASYAGSSDFNASASTAQAVAASDFTLSSSVSSLTLTAGQSANAILTFTPGSGGFAQTINVSCTGAPAAATCAVSPASLTPGSATATATLTFTTTARSPQALGPGARSTGMELALLALLPGWAAFRRRRSLPSLFLAVACIAGLALSAGCGGSNGSGTTATRSSSGTPAGPVTLTVTSTAAGAQPLTRTATVAVQVN